jgi:hypothetical protein
MLAPSPGNGKPLGFAVMGGGVIEVEALRLAEISPLAVCSAEGRPTEPTAGAQRWRRDLSSFDRSQGGNRVCPTFKAKSCQ